MEFLASLFVGKPLNILAVAAFFLVAYVVLRSTTFGGGRHHKQILVASATWGLYATWEWVVKVRTPEANIRVDLLVIWPGLAILSAWALFRSLR